jgi:hypothetical protein
MEPHDDPEARIRALEQPLADTARATELGTTPYGYGAPWAAPPPVSRSTAVNTPPGYAPRRSPPPQSSAGIPWVVLGIGAVLFMALTAGVGFYIVNKSTQNFPISPASASSILRAFDAQHAGHAFQPTTAPPGGQLSRRHGREQDARMQRQPRASAASPTPSRSPVTARTSRSRACTRSPSKRPTRSTRPASTTS